MADRETEIQQMEDIWQCRPSHEKRITELEAERDSLRAVCAEMRVALANLEKANEALCAARSRETYLSIIDGGGKDLLCALDEARKAARQAISSDGSGYAAVVSAAQVVANTDDNSIAHAMALTTLRQRVDALDKGDA